MHAFETKLIFHDVDCPPGETPVGHEAACRRVERRVSGQPVRVGEN